MPSPFRIGDRLYLRAPEPGDAPLLARWMSDPDITQHLLSGPFPFDEGKERAFIERMSASSTDVVLLACLRVATGELPADAPIGLSGFHGIDPIHRFCTFGIVVGEKSLHDRGLGTELTGLMLDHAFDELNIERVELSVYDTNPRAHAVYTKLGFVEEGRLVGRRWKRGAWRDEILMVMRRTTWRPTARST